MGPHSYLLNILGKKSDLSGDPGNTYDRRTIFAPENMQEYLNLYWSGNDEAIRYIIVNEASGDQYGVVDPNMFPDGECVIEIPERPKGRTLKVYFVALGKPGAPTDIEGWIYNATDNTYMFEIGSVTVQHKTGKDEKGGGKPDWKDGTDMLWVAWNEIPSEIRALLDENTYPSDPGMYVFDFIDLLKTVDFEEQSYLYLWKIVGGCKHIQVRFYED